MRALSKLESDRYGFKTIFHTIMAIVILFAGNLLASLPVDLFYSITKLEASPMTTIIRAILTVVTVFLLTYLYIVKILKKPLVDFRINNPKNIVIWALCALTLPLSVSVFFTLLVPGTFAVSGLSTEQITQRILYAVFSSCLVAGISEELVFRGLIMRLLETRWNKYIAVIVPSLLFGVLHIFNIENPNIMDITMLLVAGTSVGIMFSMIAYQSGSIWASALVHGIWNLSIIGKIFEISIDPGNSIFTYTLNSNSMLLTGGAFGIEASLPAIIGYSIVILLACILHRRSSMNKE